MKEYRYTLIIIILLIGGLNTYSLFDMFTKIYIVIDNYNTSLILIMILSIFISLTFIPAALFNQRTLNKKSNYKQIELLDQLNSIKQDIPIIIKIGYIVFGTSLFFLSSSILIKNIFGSGASLNLLAYLILSILMFLGALFIWDCLNQKKGRL